jgi:hypothetical protein
VKNNFTTLKVILKTKNSKEPRLRKLELEDKRIYFVMSPHINYYHSYRGDSFGTDGFGLDMKIMRKILDDITICEDQGLCKGKVRISWDYSDLYWSVQLQQKYQPEVLENVIERCKQGKDEVIIGSWGNCALPILNTEEFIQQCTWNLENSIGIGLQQLFPNRIAPYLRVQETMFTHGMIELFEKVGIKGILNYYAVIPFDTCRPLINPRLDWNQRYGLVDFKSTVSDVNCFMIPMYGIGDIIDHLSIEKWFEFIRKKQKSGDIEGHALVVLNHDMDSPAWKGTKVPKFLRWMPNTGGIKEFIKAVDKFEYVELMNLLDIVPKLKKYGAITIKQDLADGCWCGYYNWAQKYSNTQYWTLSQHARWLKCATDTLIAQNITQTNLKEINAFLRHPDDSFDTYTKNMILFSSTTHFGMSMPFQHPHRQKTALKYGIKSFKLAEKAFSTALEIAISSEWRSTGEDGYNLYILPIQNRGTTEKEISPIYSTILIKSDLPSSIITDGYLVLHKDRYCIWKDEINEKYVLEGFLSPSSLNKKGYFKYRMKNANIVPILDETDIDLNASTTSLKNKFIKITFDKNGKIKSFLFKGREFSSKNFLDSAIVFGHPKDIKKYNSLSDKVKVLHDGSNNFSASVRISSNFAMIDELEVTVKKTLKVYADIPYLFIDVQMIIPEIKGIITSDSNIYGVKITYDDRWQEVIPCEIRPNILGMNNNYLRIWKHNFFGHTNHFDLDMADVDPKNADVDCFVSNVSNGWMAVSNQEKGLLIGFNSLKAANFAFTPIKIREKGFEDLEQIGQQIRINPFGTYFGKMLHHWIQGSTGHAQQIIPNYSNTFKSTAPTFSGKTLEFNLLLSPYLIVDSDMPPKSIQSFANHFSFPPLVIFQDRQTGQVHGNHSLLDDLTKKLVKKYNIEKILNKTYLEWVEIINQEEKIREEKERDDISLSFSHMIRFLIDGLRSKF